MAMTELESELNMIEKKTVELHNFKKTFCSKIEEDLQQAFETLNSVPQPTEAEAFANYSFVVEGQKKINQIQELLQNIESENSTLK